MQENRDTQGLVTRHKQTLWFWGLLLLTAYAAVYAVMAVKLYAGEGHLGLDSHAYWAAGRSSAPWDLPPGYIDAFLYSPLFQQLVSIPAMLPWPVFGVLWFGIEAACFSALLRPLRWRARLPLLLLCAPAMLYGNIVGMLTVAAVLGMKRPAFWAFALLTKVTVGAFGILWFAARGEWRHLAELVATVFVLVAVSWIIDPQAWQDWISFLVSNRDAGAGSGTGMWIRFAVVSVVVVFAARRDWAWIVPLGLLGLSSHVTLHAKELAHFAALGRLLPQSASRR